MIVLLILFATLIFVAVTFVVVKELRKSQDRSAFYCDDEDESKL